MGRLDAPFAYATGKSEEGHHTGSIFCTLGYIYFDEASLLMHPDHIVEPPYENSRTLKFEHYGFEEG